MAEWPLKLTGHGKTDVSYLRTRTDSQNKVGMLYVQPGNQVTQLTAAEYPWQTNFIHSGFFFSLFVLALLIVEKYGNRYYIQQEHKSTSTSKSTYFYPSSVAGWQAFIFFLICLGWWISHYRPHCVFPLLWCKYVSDFNKVEHRFSFSCAEFVQIFTVISAHVTPIITLYWHLMNLIISLSITADVQILNGSQPTNTDFIGGET